MKLLTSDENKNLLENALCRGKGPALFFPDDGPASPSNLAMCYEECGVRDLCLLSGMEDFFTDGYWGGISQRGRKRLFTEANILVRRRSVSKEEAIRKVVENACMS